MADAIDVRLLIDVSGSMKRNDPENLRQPALELLVELLPEGSKAGVWTFGKWVNMLVPHRQVDENWRQKALVNAKKITSVGLFTNIGESLKKAAYDMQRADNSASKHIILLTDGMVDIAKQPDLNKQEWRRIVDELLPALKQAGYTIHTIALSDNADRDLLNKLSLATDGLADLAKSADDLMPIFLKAFDTVVPAAKVPLSDNRFVIDSSVEEFTALIFRENENESTELVSPDGQTLRAKSQRDDLRWHRTNTYDLITLTRPFEGEWGVNVQMAPRSRVTIVSNLNLSVKPVPNNIMLGMHVMLSASLLEDGIIINNSEFLAVLDVSLVIKKRLASGDQQTLVSTKLMPKSTSLANFEYEMQSFDTEGVYEFGVVVDGKTFTREFSRELAVRQPFSVDVRQSFHAGTVNYALTVVPFIDDVDLKATQVVATVTTPNGHELIRSLSLNEQDNWSTLILPDVEGRYSATIAVKGSNKKGQPISALIEDVHFNYSAEAGLNIVEPTTEPTPTPTPTEVAVVDTEPDKEASPVPEDADASSTGLPKWMIYSMLALANILLIGLGFFAYKKIMGGNDDEALLDIDDPGEPESSSSMEEGSDEDEAVPIEDEEEPPMEDLGDEPEQSAPVAEMPTEADDGNEEKSPENQEDVRSDIDDLDTMGMSDDLESTNADPEDDDMVSAMLEAQGLDLADDELDDAISSLIDDLDEDVDDTGEKKDV